MTEMGLCIWCGEECEVSQGFEMKLVLSFPVAPSYIKTERRDYQGLIHIICAKEISTELLEKVQRFISRKG